jgi:PadR family transcriptional regulator PadR
VKGGVFVDIQLKRGLLDVSVLTTIANEDSYGYKIIKDLSEHIEISESTLYPILKRLENSGSLISHTAEHNNRLRKYYKITPIGKKKVLDFLSEWEEVMDVYQFVKGEVKNEQE